MMSVIEVNSTRMRQSWTLNRMDAMLTFSLNSNHPLNSLNLPEQKMLIGLTLESFCERSLLSYGRPGSGLHIYDGILGDALRAVNSYTANSIPPEDELRAFYDSWAYRGDIYRIMRVPRRTSPFSKMTSRWIDWHGMVASWSKSCNFTTGYNHVNPDSKYCFLHASTGDAFGIDVNGLRANLGIENQYTSQENEVIFPMNKKYVVHVYRNLTPREFLKLMRPDDQQSEISADFPACASKSAEDKEGGSDE